MSNLQAKASKQEAVWESKEHKLRIKRHLYLFLGLFNSLVDIIQGLLKSLLQEEDDQSENLMLLLQMIKTDYQVYFLALS